jgi:hypothetical protein
LTGGATAVLEGWRASTIDVHLKLVPDDDELLRAIVDLKERLSMNIELAAPDDFVPVPEGWESRSRFVAQEGPLTFLHFDFVAQALAKIERGHRQDLDDVGQMLERGLVTAESIQRAFDAVVPRMHIAIPPFTSRRSGARSSPARPAALRTPEGETPRGGRAPQQGRHPQTALRPG